METTPKIVMTRPEDLVALLPYRLGFRPRDSVVLLGMCGKRLGLVSRVDLVDLAHPRRGPEILHEVGDLMVADGADDVFVVLYSDLPRPQLASDPDVRSALAHLRRLTDWADAPGPWVVGRTDYGCWGDGEECEPVGRDIGELEHGEVAATLVLHGLAVAPDRRDLAVPPTADEGRRRAATRAVREARGRLAAVRARCGGGAVVPGSAFGFPGSVPAVAQDEMEDWRLGEWRHWARLVATARAGGDLAAAGLGRLAVALEDNAVRDGVLCSAICEPPERVPDVDLVVQTLDLAMLPGGPSPDPRRVDAVTAVLRALVACVPARTGGQALGLLAWIAWWTADGARADVLAAQALRARPRTRLAELVDQALTHRVPPGWVRSAVGGDSTAEAAPIR
ncbi:MAG TPA: DUF4192 domain-containing protein [Phototrophicaceae bacterium]|nr:DUF4192 domain-containing protein [Phototrophicaceae bacterium]